jgi:CheY-like chemotaxis protein
MGTNEKQVLIVEDASNWVKRHQLSLSELGFKTFVAHDYAEAVGLLRHERFDLAVIDLYLSTKAEPENLNGVFLLQYLFEKNIPVIIVTGYGSRRLADKIYHDFDVFEILDKLAFDTEKFKNYVLQATTFKLAAFNNHEKKKAISRKKIEAFITEFLRDLDAQSIKSAPTRRESITVRTTKSLHVFISHSVKDKDLAARLANDLRAAGVEVWFDSDEINVGDSILEKIEQGAKSDFMVIILSPDAVVSWMVKQELMMFLNEEKRRGYSLILPVLYKDCDIPPLLEGRRYADFRGDYESGLAELLRSLGMKKGQNTP